MLPKYVSEEHFLSVLMSSGVELGVFIRNDRLSGSKFVHSPNTRNANGTIFSIILVYKLVCISTFGVLLYDFEVWRLEQHLLFVFITYIELS